MTALVGFACAGLAQHPHAPRDGGGVTEHPIRRYSLRNGILRTSDARGEFECPPLPRTDGLLIVDPSALRVLFMDGTSVTLDRKPASPRWRPGEPLFDKGGVMKELVGACHAGCGLFAGWDAARIVYTWPAGTFGHAEPVSGNAVPGAAGIVLVEKGSSLVVSLADGSRYMGSGGAWVPLPSLFGENPKGEASQRMVPLTALKGFAVTSGRIVARGDRFELDEAAALALIRSGRASLAEPEPVA